MEMGAGQKHPCWGRGGEHSPKDAALAQGAPALPPACGGLSQLDMLREQLKLMLLTELLNCF